MEVLKKLFIFLGKGLLSLTIFFGVILGIPFVCSKLAPLDEETKNYIRARESIDRADDILSSADKSNASNEKAILMLKEALPTLHSSDSGLLWRAYHLLGEAYYKLGNDSQSFIFTRKAITFGNMSSDYYRLGEIYYNNEDYENAIIEFQNAIIFSDGAFWQTFPLNDIARCYRHIGDYENAIIYFNRYWLSEHSKWSLEDIAECYMLIEDYESAIIYFKQYIELSDHNELSFAHWGLGMAYINTGQDKEVYNQIAILESIGKGDLAEELKIDLDLSLKGK